MTNIVTKKSIRLYNRVKTGLQLMLFPQKYYLYPKYIYDCHSPFFSQEGEDAILARFFERQPTGFYVDVGAHHPQRFSNTYYFYLRGWKGLNIDAMPGSMDIFNQIRPRDVNLEMAISDTKQSLTYYQFNEPALNGFSQSLSNDRNGKNTLKIVSQIELPTFTLAEILNEHLVHGQKVDYLTIDVEGLDLNVLKSNNWQKYRPKLVLAEEVGGLDINSIQNSPITSFLQEQQYKLWAKTVNTCFFLDTASDS